MLIKWVSQLCHDPEPPRAHGKRTSARLRKLQGTGLSKASLSVIVDAVLAVLDKRHGRSATTRTASVTRRDPDEEAGCEYTPQQTVYTGS